MQFKKSFAIIYGVGLRRARPPTTKTKKDKMKTIEYYTGTSCVQFCYNYDKWLMDFDELTQEKSKLVKEYRRIYKASGIHAEVFSSYDLAVTLNFEDRKIFITFSGTKEQCQKLVAEAKKRRFKQVI